MPRWFRSLVFAASAVLLLAAPARAELTVFQTFVGNVAVSSDGFGSTTQSGTISASVPAGATVLAAYLYTATFSNPTHTGVSATLAGQNVVFGAPVPNATACCGIASARADVTNIVKPLIDGGAGGTYDFAITEGSTSQDGEALIVVYSLASLPVGTVGILDGFASVTGDTTNINFLDPLDPTAAGFFAEMRLGIGFSCCSQQSTVSVNGTVITTSAGNNDDSADAQLSNGNLFTMGGFDDPFSPMLPSYADDHERYNLVPQISVGDTQITVVTSNASQDDNIFVALFHVSGEAGVNEPPPDGETPEPMTLSLLAMGFAGVVARARRRR